MIQTCVAPLFVPGHEVNLLPKAMASRADAIIVDLEDAVSPPNKPYARMTLTRQLPCEVIVRINDVRSPWFTEDAASLLSEQIVGVMLPKSESPADLDTLLGQLPRKLPVIALIETARGLTNVDEIAEAADRLAFGSLDYAADLGCGADAEALLYPRMRFVLASRVAGKPAPIDGVTAEYRDLSACESDTRHAAKLGFGGKLCIHPGQVGAVLAGFRPSEEELRWASAVLASANGALALDGQMVDTPVRRRAEQVVARARVDHRVRKGGNQ